MKREDLTQDLLKELLHYDPLNGIFTWKERKLLHFKDDRSCKSWNTKFSGKKAGSLKYGYIHIAIYRISYFAHRLAILYMTGKFPEIDTDHDDGVRSNNKWENLKSETTNENLWNIKIHKDNTCGFKGVCFEKRTGKYRASIMKIGIRKYLGSFETPELAHQAYCDAAKELFGNFANDGVRNLK